MRLRDALRQKFATPQEAMKALGLDESLIETEENQPMKVVRLSRTAAVAKGALLAYLRPIMAQDAKINIDEALADVTAKNFKERRPDLIKAISTHVSGKLAKDAKMEMDKMEKAMDVAEMEKEAEDAETEANSGLPMPGGGKKKAEDKKAMDKRARDWLKEKLSEDDMEGYDAMCASGMDSEEDDDKKEKGEDKRAKDTKRARDAEKDKVDEEENDKGSKDSVSKGAMDAAIKAAVKIATDTANQAQREIREAEEAVRPYVGKLIAMDGASEVYRAALKIKGVDASDIKEVAALKLLVAQLPSPDARAPRDTKIATDSSAVGSFNALYGNPAPVRHV